jgi:subtilisin family serine protease
VETYSKSTGRGNCPLFYKFLLIPGLCLWLLLNFFYLSYADEFIIKFRPGGPDFIKNPSDILTWKRSIENDLSPGTVRFRGPVGQLAQRNSGSLPNIYTFEIDGPDSSSLVIEKLSNHAEILWIERNNTFRPHLIPDDSLYGEQWALHKIGMPAAWNVQQGDSSVIIGIIDTGIDYLHEDLQSQVWVNVGEDLNHNKRLDSGDLNGLDDDGNGYIDDVIGWDFTDAPRFPDNGDFLNPDNDPMDEYPGGHGTPVAGIVAALTNNRIGIAGIAPGAKVMALRAGTAGGYLEEDDVAEAILYAIDNGCKIINMSFGDIVYSHLIKEAVDYGVGRGVIFVASAGNSGNTILHFPAAYDNTLAVGATDIQDHLASFSNYGSKIDMVAPGSEMVSCSPGNSYGTYNGTSFAAPVVCGIMGLLWSENPTASPDFIISRLQNGCQDLGSPGWDFYYGQGRVDAYKSLVDNRTTFVHIDFPATWSGTADSLVTVVGTATGSDFREYSLAWAAGENPVTMNLILKNMNRMVSDTLGIWYTGNLVDSIYTLEVKALNWDNSTFVHRVLVFLDRTAPVFMNVQFTPMVVENVLGYLISIETDDQTRASMHFRAAGSDAAFQIMESEYLNTEHHFLLTQKSGREMMELYFTVTNSSGLQQQNDNDGRLFLLDLSMPSTFDESINLLSEIQGTGFLLSQSADFNANGLLDAFGNLNIQGSPANRIGSLNFDHGKLSVNLSQTAAFPRDIFDTDRDNRPELLAGYGPESLIFPGTVLPEFTGAPVYSQLQDFWAARIIDSEEGGEIKILALHNNQWQLYSLENMQDFTVTFSQELQNPTDGENGYGIPVAGFDDLNDDGKHEIILGDSDGDLLIYQATAGDNYALLTTLRMDGTDATYRFGIGDLDNDGLPEIAVATHKLADYEGESSVSNQYWILQILKLSIEGQLTTVWEQNFYEVNTGRNRYNGITVDDFDWDGMAEIFFTPYPRAYYIQYREDHYEVNWYTSGINSFACPRVSESQFLMSGDSTIMVWQVEQHALRPLPPAGLTVTDADTFHIALQWNAVEGAEQYILKRMNTANSSIRQFITTDTLFRDSTVIKDVLYEYSLQTVDSLYQQPVSLLGNSVLVRAENSPLFLNLQTENNHQLLLLFDKPLGENSFQSGHFLLLGDSARPVSVIRARGGQAVLLGFEQIQADKSYQLVISHLYNLYNVPFYKDSLVISFDTHSSPQKPYLEKIDVISRYELLIHFNHPMEKSSVEDTSHYEMEPDDHVIKAEAVQQDNHLVRIFLTGRNRMGSLGTDYYLRIQGLTDIWGNTVAIDPGERFLIRKSIDNLDNFIVFPNPLRPASTKDEITFGNVPKGCEIFIFTANGEAVINLQNEDYSGGIRWDLRNSEGKRVNNGVYLYVAILSGQKKTGKFIIMR